VIVGPGRPPEGYGPGFLSASQVASFLGDPEPLTRWAVLMSRKGLDPFRHRDEAAEVGTTVHATIVAYLSGKPDETLLWGAVDQRAAEHAYGAFVRWWEREDRGTVTHAEWPMTSASLRLGGTLDAVLARPDGTRWLIDFKGCSALSSLTGKPKPSVWKAGHILQAGLYGALWDEAVSRSTGKPHEPRKRLEGASILYLPRDTGEAVEVSVTGAEWRQAREDALALQPLVRRHLERETWGAMARPCPELPPVELDDEITFGP
jgi:hypothetical protein